jgi:hypothetical protein
VRWRSGRCPGPCRRDCRLRERVGTDAERFAPSSGAVWKHFFIRYPEANRTHKKMLALRARSPRRRRWQAAWDNLYAAQCNDGYWHAGLGVYLPQLRHQTWIRLARVERALRRGRGLELEQLDLDLDGHPRSGSTGRLLRPAHAARRGAWRNGPISRREINLLNVLTAGRNGTTPSCRGTDPAPMVAALARIHRIRAKPWPTTWDRASFRDRFLDGPLSRGPDLRGPGGTGDFADRALSTGDGVERRGPDAAGWCDVRGTPPDRLRKTIRFDTRGRIGVAYLATGDGEAFEGWFGVELKCSCPVCLTAGEIRVDGIGWTPAAHATAAGTRCRLWEGRVGLDGWAAARCNSLERPANVALSPIRTVAQSEQGFR